MLKKKAVNAVALILGLIALGLGVGFSTAHYYTGPAKEPAQEPSVEGLFWPDPKQVQPFETVDHTGERFGLKQLEGRWSFLFFGFTHCPDICPVTLSVLDQVERELEQRGITNTQTLFVTVDPERDTTRQLSEYVGYFNPDFIGLGGSEEQIRSLTGQLGVVAARGEVSEDGDYLVDHSASVLLVDPRGRLISLFSAPHKSDEILSRFLDIREFIQRQS